MRYKLVKVLALRIAESQFTNGRIPRTLRSSADVAAVATEYQTTVCSDQERFVAFLLDSGHKVIGLHEVSVGTLNLCLVHPRDVYKAAITAGAAAVVLSHNHPSGDPNPSEEDIRLTRQMSKAGETIGIPVLDHVVTGGNGKYFSFADSRRL